MQVGRRIIYNKQNGEVLVDMGEAIGDTVLPREPLEDINLGVLDLEYGQHKEEFNRMESVRVDTVTKTLEFILRSERTLEERIMELENQLLIAEGVI